MRAHPMARALQALREDRITFDDFTRETEKDWSRLARALMRRWEVPDGVEEIDVQQEMLIAAWSFVRKWQPGRGPDLAAYVVWNACDKAKKWIHKQRDAARRDDSAPSRHARSFAKLGLEEWQEERIGAVAPDVDAVLDSHATKAALLARVSDVMSVLRTERDRYVLVAIVAADGDAAEAAADLWADPATCRAFSLSSERHAHSVVRNVIHRVVSAAHPAA